jgi:hypothetical protein
MLLFVFHNKKIFEQPKTTFVKKQKREREFEKQQLPYISFQD